MTTGGTIVPKYGFECGHCHKEWWEWMGMQDPNPQECPHCGTGSPIKKPSTFSLNNKEESEKEVGEFVEQSIINSREELEREKKENKGKTYDDI